MKEYFTGIPKIKYEGSGRQEYIESIINKVMFG